MCLFLLVIVIAVAVVITSVVSTRHKGRAASMASRGLHHLAGNDGPHVWVFDVLAKRPSIAVCWGSHHARCVSVWHRHRRTGTQA